MSYTARPRDPATWDAFAELVERNNGSFGGCWCIGFHPERGEEQYGFARVRQVGKHAWIVSRTVEPA